VDTIRGLFAASDIIDTNINSKEESACCRVWVWMEDVGKLARRGKLDLEEPLEVDSPLLHFPELGIEAGALSRRGPLKTLSYDVILHLDRVLDYSSSPPSSPDSHVSFHSDVSGMPSEISMSPACPTTWGYRWFLGFEAGTFPQPPARPSVQSRLRFPDRRDGDGGDGAGSGTGDRRSSRHGEQDGGNLRRYGGGGQGGAGFGRSQSPAEGAGGFHQHFAQTEVGQCGATEQVTAQKEKEVAEPTPMVTAMEQGLQPVACMPSLMDTDYQEGQTGTDSSSPKRKETDELEAASIGVHGLAEQFCPGWGTLVEDGVSSECTGEKELVGMQETLVPVSNGPEMVEENGLVFGPHSPRSQLEREGDGPILEDASESESENELAMESTVSDPLGDFLVSVTKKPDQAILSLADPSPKLTTRSSEDKGADMTKRSSRLAAKPSVGCSTMEKVQLVLMKKSGVLSDDASPQAADL
jgi:hypothetical protein